MEGDVPARSDEATVPGAVVDGDAAAATPRHLGRYRIDGLLGSGGMGVVLAAHDPDLERGVALKLLRRGGEAAQRRLQREAQAMARLRHPNVVTVHDVGVSEGGVFVAMERIDGGTLRAWQRSPGRGWRSIVATYVAAGRGLAAAHAAGIVHRDFKPDNVLIGDDGSVRVADFGLAGVEGDDGELTVAGTPAYMAPEQHAGSAVGPAADQFAFAASLWEALSGTRPFAAPTTEALIEAKRTHRLEPAPGARPRWAFALLRRALAPEPADRHPSMTALLRGLERGLARRRHAVVAAVALAVVGGTAVVAASVMGRAATGPSCRLAAAEVDRVWNAAAMSRITAAFAASRRPHAPATLARILPALERQAASVAAARVDACAATNERGEQSGAALDLTMACLDERVSELAALTELLGRGGDELVIDGAYLAVTALPGANDCAGELDPRRPPPAIAADVERVQHRLHEAESLLAAGMFDAAKASADALVPDARALGFAPLTAQVLNLRARAIVELGGKAEGGAAAFQEAAQAAAAATDDRLIALAWLGQTALLADAGGKPAEALEQLGFAEVAVARAGGAALQEELLKVRGDVYLDLGRLADARAELEQARASIAAREPDDPLAASRIDQRLANVLFELGEYAQALELDRKTLATWSDQLGPDHPKVAMMLNNLGIRLDEASAYEEARLVLERALSIKERTLGPEHSSLAPTLNNLSLVAAHQGRRADSAAYNERALAIREKALGPDHPDVASSLTNLSTDRSAQGRYDEALALQQRALAIREKTKGPEHASVGSTLNAMADTLLMLGRVDDALAAVRRAIAIREKALGPTHLHVGRSLMRLADVYLAMHRDAEACQALARALPIMEATQGADDSDLAQALTGHAHCLLEAGRPAEALAVAERSRTIAEESGMAPHTVGRARFVIARALWALPAKRAGAGAEAAAALAAFEADPDDTTAEVVELETWMKVHVR